jgi:tRNA (guanine-N7-)-methyltransferase
MPEKKNEQTDLQKKINRLNNLDEILRKAEDWQGVEIEIGCGNGHFLAEYCKKIKNLFIGIEIKQKRCKKCTDKIAKQKINNAYIIKEFAEPVIDKLPDESVDIFHIYFPDPWPKQRHRKRRFFRQPMLEELYTKMKPGGLIYFATDYFDYSVQAKLLCLLYPGLRLVTSSPPDEAFISVFANRFKEENRNLFHITAIKDI